MAAGGPYLRALAEASAAYANKDLSKALSKLELADQIQRNIPDTWNMRGAVYAQRHEFDKAADAFEKAGRLNPGDFWPPYNVAQLLLMQKKFGEAAAALEKLVVYRGHEELVEFYLVYADLMEGKAEAAKPVLDGMKFPSDTPAYYYARAAWAFAHKDEKEGDYWSGAGLKVFGLERCGSFYDALAGAGWMLPRNPDGSLPIHTELSTLPAATPAPGALR